MKRIALILCLLATPAYADYLGSWKIDDLLTFAANTHATTGAATDADSVPSYRVYEDETGTAILSGSMAKLDDANTTGFYSEQLTLSAANGFEKGKSYTIYISAAVSSTTGTMSHNFQLGADVRIIDGTGTGEVNTSGGYVFSDLTKILGTTLTESSAGNLANNLKTFLDNGDSLTTARLDYITDIRGYTDTEVSAIKTKTDYLPSATAGASGGLLISGSNSGTTTLAALTVTGTTTMSDGLVIDRSSSNSSAIVATGSGTGSGARFLSGTGATGNGIAAVAQSTNGHGFSLTGTGIGGGITSVGGSTGAGALFQSGNGATGDGVQMTASSTNGSGLTLTRTGTGDDLKLTNSDSPGIAAVVWNALKASYTTPDSFGDYLDDEISSVSGGGGGGSSADDIWSFDLTTATGIADPDTAAYKLVNATDIEDFIDDIATAAGGVVSAFLVDDDHTWGFQSRSQTTSPQLITEIRGTGGFNGLVAMDFTVPMPANASISSVGTVGVADETGKTEPTLSAASLSPDKKKVHVPVNATAATAGTYTISVTITTTDSQTFMRKGRLVLE